MRSIEITYATTQKCQISGWNAYVHDKKLILHAVKIGESLFKCDQLQQSQKVFY